MGCVALVVCFVFLVLLLFIFLFLLLSVGVRGSARAALRARTLSPNTIASLLLCSLFSVSRLSSRPAFPVIVEWRWGLPCVGVLCWHDCDGESVSFVLVFLIVACSSFSSSAVAASAVAFGAEDSPVVWMVGSA